MLIVVLFHILLLLVTYINPISLQCNNKANNYLRDEKIVFLTILHKDENWTFQGFQQLISLNKREEKKKALMTSQILAQVRSSQRALRHGDTCTPSPHHTKMNLLLTTSQFTDPNAFPSPISLCEGSIKEQGSVPRCTYNAGSTTGSNILELSCCCTAVCSNC